MDYLQIARSGRLDNEIRALIAADLIVTFVAKMDFLGDEGKTVAQEYLKSAGHGYQYECEFMAAVVRFIEASKDAPGKESRYDLPSDIAHGHELCAILAGLALLRQQRHALPQPVFKTLCGGGYPMSEEAIDKLIARLKEGQ